MLTEQVYPYQLEPLEKPALWGGQALVARYGKSADPAAEIGESWECWDDNRVDNGELSGSTLAQLRAGLGVVLMGSIDAAAPFPVLTKLIDARLALSVQVHPDDAYARRVENQPNGKTECWYILAAEPKAELVLGWARETDRAEYERRVADGSLGDILRRVSVHAGETYYLPAGTLHAIGAGIQLFEAQQASDLTYRIFDWNRVGPDGKTRELHVAKAADVLDFRAGTRVAVTTLTFESGGLERTLLVADPHFTLERLRCSARAQIQTHGQPLTITALASPVRLELGALAVDVKPFATVVVPAAAEAVTCTSGEMLAVRPQASLDTVRADAAAGGARAAELDLYFGQFA